MAKIKNVRIEQPITPKKHESSTSLKQEIKKIKAKFNEVPKAKKIFYLSITLFVLTAMIVIGCLATGMKQSLLMAGLLAIVVITTAICHKPIELKKHDYIKAISIFAIILCVVSFAFSIVSMTDWKEQSVINKEVRTAKKDSILIVETDLVEIYVNCNDQKVYAVSNINGQKYVNQNSWSAAEESEYYNLYNVGIQYNISNSEISELFIYPPSPYTTTGYDYLIEFIYNKQRYVTRIFLPGYVDFNYPVSTHLFQFRYANTEDKTYDVRRIDEYLLFQSTYSTFSTPFKNVTYTSANEYFYVRYNRYLRAHEEVADAVEEINEKNVVFINSIQVMSSTISKVNFFYIGDVINETFVAAFPVMEIVYANGTCDIAIIKDIDIANISSAIT